MAIETWTVYCKRCGGHGFLAGELMCSHCNGMGKIVIPVRARKLPVRRSLAFWISFALLTAAAIFAVLTAIGVLGR
ncbi:MAG: hypothetical protein ACRD2O_00200 [Terriglobia bacterium]